MTLPSIKFNKKLSFIVSCVHILGLAFGMTETTHL